MLSSQIRDFHKLLMVAAMVFAEFLFSWKKFFSLFFAKNLKYCEKVCKIGTEIFAFFHERFCSLETLGGLHLSVNYKTFFQTSISYITVG